MLCHCIDLPTQAWISSVKTHDDRQKAGGKTGTRNNFLGQLAKHNTLKKILRSVLDICFLWDQINRLYRSLKFPIKGHCSLQLFARYKKKKYAQGRSKKSQEGLKN